VTAAFFIGLHAGTDTDVCKLAAHDTLGMKGTIAVLVD